MNSDSLTFLSTINIMNSLVGKLHFADTECVGPPEYSLIFFRIITELVFCFPVDES